MTRLLRLCGISLLLYWGVFAVVLDRPLSLGLLRLQLLQKTAALAALPSPKLVILAGSNGPYSHSCVVLSAMLNMPCENAGIAVGIGLDDILLRYAPLLHKGDVVYMPMELQQYAATSAQYRAGVDGGFLLRHDRNVLAHLPLPRILGAAFCCTLADLAESLAEMPLAAAGTVSPATLLASAYNPQGDRIDNNLASRDAALLTHPPRLPPSAGQINNGYGTALIARFIATETRKGVTIIGGMPVDFSTAQIPDQLIQQITAIYAQNGGSFLLLPGKSQYPAADFFNGEDHLAKPCQYLHSMALAQALAAQLHRPIKTAPDWVAHLARDCPVE